MSNLDTLLKEAVERFNNLPKEQQLAMLMQQRQSWVDGEVAMAKEDRAQTSVVMPNLESSIRKYAEERLQQSESELKQARSSLTRLRDTVAEYIEARNAYEAATKPKGAFGSPQCLQPNNPVVVRYREARHGLTLGYPQVENSQARSENETSSNRELLPKPNMFWDNSNPEESYAEDLGSLIDDLPVDEVMIVDNAVRLPLRYAAWACTSLDEAGQPDDRAAVLFDTFEEAEICWSKSLSALGYVSQEVSP